MSIRKEEMETFEVRMLSATKIQKAYHSMVDRYKHNIIFCIDRKLKQHMAECSIHRIWLPIRRSQLITPGRQRRSKRSHNFHF